MKVAVVVAVLTGTVVAGPVALAAGSKRACTGWEYRAEHATPPSVRESRMKRLIGCVLREVGIPGFTPTAIAIADRESSFYQWAVSYTGCCKGLFQHHAAYWSGRAHALPKHQFPRWPVSGIFNARANAWAAAQMMKSQGGVCPAWC